MWGLRVGGDPRDSVGLCGTGTCPGCHLGPGCVSSKAPGGAKLLRSLLPLW